MPASKGVPRPLEWVREWQRGDQFLENWRGVYWGNAPVPKRQHVCQAQTRGKVRIAGLPLMSISRCACGAVDYHDGEGWEDRNSRTK